LQPRARERFRHQDETEEDHTMQTRFIKLLPAVGAILVLAGCAAEVEQREDLLSAAGFRVKTASTADRLRSMQALPPHRFVRESLNGREVWVYTDPTVCKCLYVGTPDAYQRYQQLNVQQRIADENVEAAQLASTDWGIGPYGWGPWGGWGF
jgi:hypothetical protein